MIDLEIINKLYLELSHVATATTQRELCLEQMLSSKTNEHNQTIEQLYKVAELIKAGDSDKALELIDELTIPF